MKKILAVGLIGVMLLCLTGCMGDESSNKEKAYQEELLDKANEEVGMPNITEFTEKKMAKMIWEMRDDADLITYSYITNLDGKFVYLGQSIGYGLPYSTQYTSPLKKISGYELTTPQADPNGLYSGDGLLSTWVMLMDETTKKVSPVYVEQELFVSTHKLPKRLCDESSLPSNY